MPGKPADTTVAHQVELAIRRLDSLSILPCVAAQFLSQLNQFQLSPSNLAELIESDPSLTAKIFSLMHQQAKLTAEDYSVRHALDKLPLRLIRDAFLSLKVYAVSGRDEHEAMIRKQLVLHSLAVACCAKDIAEIMSPRMDLHLAYCAGLLHDIGKLALTEAMPRSFARIVEQAKSQNACTCTIEQKHLGTDHTILGKRLAHKWHLPNKIALAIWLHHSDTRLISQSMPEAGIAQIVQLADTVTRQCNIGQSGSYDLSEPSRQIVQSLGISLEQLQQIRQSLPDAVAQKSKVLGLDLPNAEATYCNVIGATTAQLAREHTELSQQSSQLQAASSHFDFIRDFLLSISSNTAAIEMAESFAARWQKFYQTGPVCLYLAPLGSSQTLEAVVVESPSQTKTVILHAPAETPAIPQVATNSFVILDAQHCAAWLFEQLDVDFDLSRTKLVPLLSNSKAIGAIAFECRYPAEAGKLAEGFKSVTSIAAAILDMASACHNQQRYAEQFARLLAEPKTNQGRLATADRLEALAEMAAGAAHELNNPLSVISGRAQLLAEAETDSRRKQILKQIQENTNEISGIIDELMAFARPPQPRPAQVDIKQILNEAAQLTSQRHNIEQLDVRLDVADVGKSVFVDSAQLVSAIANVFSNALESYTDDSGPIKVAAATDETGKFVKLQITDLGCGMPPEIVQKATNPFFSAKPAGRKRGMGLAYAQRLIQLNNGSLHITSQPGSGTTVTISLPCEQEHTA